MKFLALIFFAVILCVSCHRHVGKYFFEKDDVVFKNIPFDTFRTDSNIIIKSKTGTAYLKYEYKSKVLDVDFYAISKKGKEYYFKRIVDSIFYDAEMLHILDETNTNYPCLDISSFKKLQIFNYINRSGRIDDKWDKSDINCYLFQDLTELKGITSTFFPDNSNVKNYLEEKNVCEFIVLVGDSKHYLDSTYLRTIIKNQKIITRIYLYIAVTGIPDDIAELEKLRSLELYTPKAIALNPAMARMKNLTDLTLSIDFSKKENWEILGTFSSLESLSLEDKGTGKGTIYLAENWQNLKNLRSVILHTKKKIVLPENLGKNLESLEYIYGNFDLSDNCTLRQIAEMPKIGFINIGYPPFSYPVFDEIFKLFEDNRKIKFSLLCKKEKINKLRELLINSKLSKQFTISIWGTKNKDILEGYWKKHGY